MEGIIRDEWKFDGMIMSDWQVVSPYTANARYGTYSAFEALEAGLDLEMPGPGVWRGERLMRGVSCGKLEEAVIDKSAKRVSLYSSGVLTRGAGYRQLCKEIGHRVDPGHSSNSQSHRCSSGGVVAEQKQ